MWFIVLGLSVQYILGIVSKIKKHFIYDFGFLISKKRKFYRYAKERIFKLKLPLSYWDFVWVFWIKVNVCALNFGLCMNVHKNLNSINFYIFTSMLVLSKYLFLSQIKIVYNFSTVSFSEIWYQKKIII